MDKTSPLVAPGVRLVRDHPMVQSLAVITLFATLTALGAQCRISLPFTPVPMTLQVFFVLLSGVALGSRLGAASQVQYLAMGAAGLPVFAGGAHGVVAFAGPTAGYLFGFVAAAGLVGWFTERLQRVSLIGLLLAMVAGVAAVYAPGVLWLSVWLHAARHAPWGSALHQAVLLGVVPFLGVDLMKATLAASLGVPLCRYGRRQ